MRLSNKRKQVHTSDIVLNRLKIILAGDRSCCQTYIITQITEDIKKTISKYTCIFDKTDIKVLHENTTEKEKFLVVKVPIGELNTKNS